MATRRDIQTHEKSDRLERLIPRGYTLGKDHRPEDLLAIEVSLLRSEGLDPTWPRLDEQSRD